MFVVVRRQWDSWRQAKYRLADLGGAHWGQMSGGVGKRAPQPFIHGYVSCEGMVEGELDHSCMHGEGPHSIKVCIVRKDNDKATYSQLLEQVGPKPERRAPKPIKPRTTRARSTPPESSPAST
jgi:hypothetical protein